MLDIKKRPPGGGLGGASEADGRSCYGIGVKAEGLRCVAVALKPHAIDGIFALFGSFEFLAVFEEFLVFTHD